MADTCARSPAVQFAGNGAPGGKGGAGGNGTPGMFGGGNGWADANGATPSRAPARAPTPRAAATARRAGPESDMAHSFVTNPEPVMVTDVVKLSRIGLYLRSETQGQLSAPVVPGTTTVPGPGNGPAPGTEPGTVPGTLSGTAVLCGS